MHLETGNEPPIWIANEIYVTTQMMWVVIIRDLYMEYPWIEFWSKIETKGISISLNPAARSAVIECIRHYGIVQTLNNSMKFHRFFHKRNSRVIFSTSPPSIKSLIAEFLTFHRLFNVQREHRNWSIYFIYLEWNCLKANGSELNNNNNDATWHCNIFHQILFKCQSNSNVQKESLYRSWGYLTAAPYVSRNVYCV